jgi:PleD family two-component response regulator
MPSPHTISLRKRSIGTPKMKIMAASPRILIVEDDPGIREYLELGLQFEGFEISSTGMASEALFW